MEAEQEVLRAAWLKSSASGILVRRNILGVHAYTSGKREKALLYFLNKHDYPRKDEKAKWQRTGGKATWWCFLSAATVLLLHKWVMSLMEHKTTSVHKIAGLPQVQRPLFQSTVCLRTEMEGGGEKPHGTGNRKNWFLLLSTSINFLNFLSWLSFLHFIYKQRYYYFHLPFFCLLDLFRLYTFEDPVTDQCPGKHCQQKKQQKKTTWIWKIIFFCTQYLINAIPA